MAPEINLFIHLLGFGLLLTPLVSGLLLEIQLRHAKDPQSRASITRMLRSIGILSPIAMVIMLLTGIGNMHFSGYSMLRMPGWLAFKIVAFVIVIISGILFAIQSRKRGALLQHSAGNEPQKEQELRLKHINRQITLAYIVMFILILVIVYLSVAGTSGAQ